MSGIISWTGKNVKIFNNSSFIHTDDRIKYYLILAKGPANGLDDTTNFAGVPKYFRYILMDHEIISKFLMGHKIFSHVLFS